MSGTVDSLRTSFAVVYADSGVVELKRAFLEELPTGVAGKAMFADAVEAFTEDELPDVCAEVVAALTESCEQNDSRGWDYDHLEFIIDLSSRYGFALPQELVAGVPQQLITLLDATKPQEPEDE